MRFDSFAGTEISIIFDPAPFYLQQNVESVEYFADKIFNI